MKSKTSREEILESSSSFISVLFFWVSYSSESRVKDKEGTREGRETELGNVVCLLHDFQKSLPKSTVPKEKA